MIIQIIRENQILSHREMHYLIVCYRLLELSQKIKRLRPLGTQASSAKAKMTSRVMRRIALDP